MNGNMAVTKQIKKIIKVKEFSLFQRDVVYKI